MAKRDLSLDDIFSKTPPLDELCEHIRVGIKWYLIGVQLKLDVKELDVIEELNKDVTIKTTKMFQLWLSTNPQASRNEIVKVLKKGIIGEKTLAEQYETTLKELYVSTGKCEVMIMILILVSLEGIPNEAITILHHYHTVLSQALIYPVQVSQMLYSERCISEITLDGIEPLEVSLNNKKTTLMTAMSASVISDHQNLRVLATVFFKFEEMRSLASKILCAYSKNYYVTINIHKLL